MLVLVLPDSHTVLHYWCPMGISLGIIGFGLIASYENRYCFNKLCRVVWVTMGLVDIFVTVLN